MEYAYMYVINIPRWKMHIMELSVNLHINVYTFGYHASTFRFKDLQASKHC